MNPTEMPVWKQTKSSTRNSFQKAKIGCAIMASGLGKRFGDNKLLAEFKGEPLICQILTTTADIFFSRVIVTRHKEIEAIAQAQNINCVLHSLPLKSDTVRLGTEALENCDRILFCQGDQPLLRKKSLMEMLQLSDEFPEMIIRACHKEILASPVIFPKWCFEELKSISQDKGGNVIIKNHTDKVINYEVSSPYELMDIDTKEDLKLLEYIKIDS